MRSKPIQPKRADFASFDDYFDAMIQFHLEQSPFDTENLQLSPSSVSHNGTIKLPEATAAWRQRLQQFVQAHQQ